MRSLFVSILALATIAGTVHNASSQEPDRAKELFVHLQDEKDSDAAAIQLLKDARENEEIRTYLAANLPTLIRTSAHGKAWINSIRLSGELKIDKAAPVLASLLARSDTFGGDGVGDITFYRLATLQNDSPGKALAQIGDPAVPAIASVFDNGDRTARLRAVYVLRTIDSPSSTEALRRQLSVEKDPGLQRLIENSVK